MQQEDFYGDVFWDIQYYSTCLFHSRRFIFFAFIFLVGTSCILSFQLALGSCWICTVLVTTVWRSCNGDNPKKKYPTFLPWKISRSEYRSTLEGKEIQKKNCKQPRFRSFPHKIIRAICVFLVPFYIIKMRTQSSWTAVLRKALFLNTGYYYSVGRCIGIVVVLAVLHIAITLYVMVQLHNKQQQRLRDEEFPTNSLQILLQDSYDHDSDMSLNSNYERFSTPSKRTYPNPERSRTIVTSLWLEGSWKSINAWQIPFNSLIFHRNLGKIIQWHYPQMLQRRVKE